MALRTDFRGFRETGPSPLKLTGGPRGMLGQDGAKVEGLFLCGKSSFIFNGFTKKRTRFLLSVEDQN